MDNILKNKGLIFLLVAIVVAVSVAVLYAMYFNKTISSAGSTVDEKQMINDINVILFQEGLKAVNIRIINVNELSDNKKKNLLLLMQ